MANMKYFCVAIVLATLLAGCSPATQFAQMTEPLASLVVEARETLAAENVDAEAETTSNSEVAASTAPIPVLAYAPAARTADPARAELNRLIEKYAALYNVPVSLVHKVVNRESTYNPGARNGIYIGLMQLNPQTARTMGFAGRNSDLYDAETNLKYGVKYLAGAYLVAKGNAARADKLYQTGYYYHAKRMGLLKETGLRG